MKCLHQPAFLPPALLSKPRCRFRWAGILVRLFSRFTTDVHPLQMEHGKYVTAGWEDSWLPEDKNELWNSFISSVCLSDCLSVSVGLPLCPSLIICLSLLACLFLSLSFPPVLFFFSFAQMQHITSLSMWLVYSFFSSANFIFILSASDILKSPMFRLEIIFAFFYTHWYDQTWETHIYSDKDPS